MGATYCSIILKTDESAKVEAAIKHCAQSPAFLSSALEGWVSVFPKGDYQRAMDLAAILSAQLNCSALYNLVFHEDFFYYSAFRKGKRVDEFHSNPGDPLDPLRFGRSSPSGGDVEKLCTEFNIDKEHKENIAAVLRGTEFVFPSDRLRALIAAMDIPSSVVGHHSLVDDSSGRWVIPISR